MKKKIAAVVVAIGAAIGTWWYRRDARKENDSP